jgi:tetratricopeptide (TPR) repeat protein
VRARTAAAHHRIGEIHQRLGDAEEAESSYRQALAIYEELIDRRPPEAALVVAKARAMNDLGILFAAHMRPRPEEEHRRAIEFLAVQPPAIGADRRVRFELARAHDLAGSVGARSGMMSLALDSPAAPDRPRDGPDRRPPDSRRTTGSDGPGSSRPKFDPAAIEKDLARACAILAALVEEEPGNSQFRAAQARAERHRYVHFLFTNQRDRVAASFQTARGLLEALVQEFPADPSFRLELADTLSLAGTRRAAMPVEEAEVYLTRAVDLCLQLAAAFPSIGEYQALLATSHRGLARINRTRGRLADAEQHLELARARLDQLVARHSTNAFYPLTLGQTALDLAEVKRRRGEEERDPARLAESREVLDAAIARLANDPNNPFRRRMLATMYESLAATLRAQGDDAAARQAAEESKRLAQSLFRGPFRKPAPER